MGRPFVLFFPKHWTDDEMQCVGKDIVAAVERNDPVLVLPEGVRIEFLIGKPPDVATTTVTKLQLGTEAGKRVTAVVTSTTLGERRIDIDDEGDGHDV